jgi:hypothetical protein
MKRRGWQKTAEVDKIVIASRAFLFRGTSDADSMPVFGKESEVSIQQETNSTDRLTFNSNVDSSTSIDETNRQLSLY